MDSINRDTLIEISKYLDALGIITLLQSNKHLYQIYHTERLMKLIGKKICEYWEITTKRKYKTLADIVTNSNYIVVKHIYISHNKSKIFNFAVRYENESILRHLIHEPEIQHLLSTQPKLFYQQCINNRCTSVSYLLGVPYVNPSINNNKAFINTCQIGHVEIVKLLLQKISLTNQELNCGFLNAINNKHLDIINLLLEHPQINLTIDDNKLFRVSCIKSWPEIILMLYDAKNIDMKLAKIGIYLAMMNSNLEIISLLLDRFPVDITDKLEQILTLAVNANCDPLITFILINYKPKFKDLDYAGIKMSTITQIYPYCDAAEKNKMLKHAIVAENGTLINMLIYDPEIDFTQHHELLDLVCKCNWYEIAPYLLVKCVPTHKNLQTAISSNSTNMSRLLLMDKRIDPSINDNEALLLAISLILSDPRVDPSMDQNKALLSAISSESSNVVKLILADSRVDPSADQNKALLSAISSGSSVVVKLLLNDSRIDPSIPDNMPIIVACKNKHAAIVTLLLKHSKFDPTFGAEMLLREAMHNNCPNIVERFILDDRMDISNIVLFTYACCNNQKSMVKMLIKYYDYSQGTLVQGFNNAYKHKSYDVMKYLITCEIGEKAKYEILESACRDKQIKFIQLLLSDPTLDSTQNNNQLIKTMYDKCKVLGHYDLDTLKVLYNDPKINDSLKQNDPQLYSSISSYLLPRPGCLIM